MLALDCRYGFHWVRTVWQWEPHARNFPKCHRACLELRIGLWPGSGWIHAGASLWHTTLRARYARRADPASEEPRWSPSTTGGRAFLAEGRQTPWFAFV